MFSQQQTPLLILRFIYIFFALLVFVYLIPNSPPFPQPPPDAVQSLEKADTEDVFRRAYFTNLNRQEVLQHYQTQMGQVQVFGFKVPSYRLNYPPEHAFVLIRDQTRSTFLEEIVHPLRESFYVNGFEPKVAKDDIWYKSVHYTLKITVKYVDTNLYERLTIIGLSLITLLVTIEQLGKIFIDILKGKL